MSSCTLMHSRAKNTNVWKSRGCCCCVLSSARALASQRARCMATEGNTTPGRGRGAQGCPHHSSAGSVLLSTESKGLGLMCSKYPGQALSQCGQSKGRSGLGERKGPSLDEGDAVRLHKTAKSQGSVPWAARPGAASCETAVSSWLCYSPISWCIWPSSVQPSLPYLRPMNILHHALRFKRALQVYFLQWN